MLLLGKPLPRLVLKLHLKKSVTTWTPLATAFNSPPYKKINFTRNEAVRIWYLVIFNLTIPIISSNF